MRLVFFGTPEFAVPSFMALLASPHEVAAVVTQPDRPRGRGQRVSDAPVKALAARHGVPVLQPDRLRDDAYLERMRALAPDLGVVAAYGKILPDVLLAVPRLGFINVHASLLPKYRGAAPVNHAVMAGERETGVSIMRIVGELDAGPVFATESRPIGDDEDSAAVEADLARIGARLLVEIVALVSRGAATEVPQDDRLATFAPRLAKEDGAIDWRKPAAVLHNLVRGLHPWPHAFTSLGGTRHLIHRASPAPPLLTAVEPGTIVDASGDRLIVAAGERSALQILSIQPEGRRIMSAREFLAGHRALAGTRLTQDSAEP